MTGRLLAIGDIHGCLEQLRALLETVKPTGEDRLVFLGDYVDRGPDSAGVIEFLIDFGQSYPGTVFLMGNHEQMFLDSLAGKDISMFLINGGTNTLNSYEEKNWLPIPDRHVTFLKNLRFSFVTNQYIFVHAGLRPGVPVEEQKEHDLIWIREDFIASDYNWEKTIVYGHTPTTTPQLSAKRIGLDTGCVYGRHLTCCNVITHEFWQVGN